MARVDTITIRINTGIIDIIPLGLLFDPAGKELNHFPVIAYRITYVMTETIVKA